MLRIASLLFVIGCSAPGEAPPLAPRPGPSQPVPGSTPIPTIDPTTDRPVPQAPPKDAGVPVSMNQEFQSSVEMATDAGIPNDAAVAPLPPVPGDALPPDANRRAQ